MWSPIRCHLVYFFNVDILFKMDQMSNGCVSIAVVNRSGTDTVENGLIAGMVAGHRVSGVFPRTWIVRETSIY